MRLQLLVLTCSVALSQHASGSINRHHMTRLPFSRSKQRPRTFSWLILRQTASSGDLLPTPPHPHTSTPAYLFGDLARFPVGLGVVHRSPDPLHQLVQLDRGLHQHGTEPLAAVLHTQTTSDSQLVTEVESGGLFLMTPLIP